MKNMHQNSEIKLKNVYKTDDLVCIFDYERNTLYFNKKKT